MPRPIRPTDLYSLESIIDPTLDPGGARVVYSVAWPDEATDETRARLHVLDDDGARLLVDGHRDTRPTFSPSGERLAFLRAEPKTPAVPAVLEADGTVTTLEGFPDGCGDVAWLDERRLVVLAPRRPDDQVGVDDDELKRRPRRIARLGYRFNGRGWTNDRPRVVRVVDIATGATTDVTPVDADCSAMAPARDASAVLAVLPDDDAELTGANGVWLHRLDGSEPVRLTEPGGSWTAVGWTLDDVPFATGHPVAAVTDIDRPHRLDPTGATRPIVFGTDDVNCTALLGGSASPVVIDGALLLPGIRRGTVTIDRHDLATGDTTVRVAAHGVVTAFAATSDGARLVGTLTTPTRPAELFDFSGPEPVRLVALNEPLLADLDLVEPEIGQIESTDGAVVEAFLLRPPASAPTTGNRRPALLYVHGGPMSTYGLGFFDEFQMAAAAGYVVIGANPRGSDGYGVEWARAVVGRMGGPDWDDVTAVADHLATLPDVDPQRIGIGGGSYGGFMTAWAIGHTDRFAAALVERCVSNWESFIGTSDIAPWFAERYCNATIETDVEAIRRQSPITYAAANTTPTLVMHSEEDWRCPPEQSEQLFAAYRRAGVDARFVRFPGENHELTRAGKPRHRVERFGIVHDFFAELLGGGRFEESR